MPDASFLRRRLSGPTMARHETLYYRSTRDRDTYTVVIAKCDYSLRLLKLSDRAVSTPMIVDSRAVTKR